ncbi:MAG: hypothetical protein IIU08_10475 [Clostridia bacterium]|nr:hypothetical protein [Clostridia bacterium]
MYFMEKESALGRADVQLGNGAIFAGLYGLQLERAEHGANPARSSVVQLKHAQDKSCGLAAVIQSRIERGQCAGFLPNVSRETFVRSSPTTCFARTDFNRLVQPAYLPESEYVREDEVTAFISECASRVMRA